MIITRLAGGLGNQMFQYAIARSYQRDESEKIILDTRQLQDLESDINKIIQRPFALDIYTRIKAEKIDNKIVKLLNSHDFITKIERKLFKLSPVYVVQRLMEPVEFLKIAAKNIYLEGNFQSELYFKSIRRKLIEDFDFPELDKTNSITKQRILYTPNAVSLHIRRGDYLSTSNKDMFTSVNLEYYQKAIDYMGVMLGISQLKTFVFTDDIAWVKKNFKSDKLDISFIEGNNGNNSWKDMCLMSCCKHHIIANSSFSWWGAWLSQREGINLAPRYWFRPDTYAYDIHDIVPQSWTIIDYILN